MSQPDAYNRETDFTDRDGDDTDHEGINTELDKAATSINQIRNNLARIQRDDGGLANGIVTGDSLDKSVVSLLQGEVSGSIDQAEAAAAQAVLAATTAVDAKNTTTEAKDIALTSANSAALNAQVAANAAASANGAACAAASAEFVSIVADDLAGLDLSSSRDMGSITDSALQPAGPQPLGNIATVAQNMDDVRAVVQNIDAVVGAIDAAAAAGVSATNAANSATSANTAKIAAQQAVIDAANASRLTGGTVTTGAAGSDAAATITGAAGAQVLNLVIPRGDTGPVGAQGPKGDAGPVGPGGGDVLGPGAAVDSELAVFSGTTGKLVKRATLSGIPKLTAGVLAEAVAGVDYVVPTGNITGSARTVQVVDSRDVVDAPDAKPMGVTYDFKKGAAVDLPEWTGVMTFRPYGVGSDWSGGPAHQLAMTESGSALLRSGSSSWGPWAVVLSSTNYTAYAPSLTGSGASGTWGISVTGTATPAAGSVTSASLAPTLDLGVLP